MTTASTALSPSKHAAEFRDLLLRVAAVVVAPNLFHLLAITLRLQLLFLHPLKTAAPSPSPCNLLAVDARLPNSQLLFPHLLRTAANSLSPCNQLVVDATEPQTRGKTAATLGASKDCESEKT